MGEYATRLNAADCKSVPSGSVVQIHLRPPYFLGCSQAVRHETLTLACTGPIPVTPASSSASSVVEHLTFNQGVVSSSLTRGTTPYFLTLPPRASKQHLPEAEMASGFSFPARRFGEMVDARDLKSLEAIPHAGSSPATGTT